MSKAKIYYLDDTGQDPDTPPIIMLGGHPEDWGLIPSFLDPNDPRPAAEQFNEKYIGGWNPFSGFSFNETEGILTYPEDPPMKVISCMLFREECILLFPHEWVLILQTADSTWQVSRMD